MPHTSLLPAPEFTILDSGLAFGTGTLHHAWFRLADPRGRESVRAVALKELAYLPIETRDDPDLLGKQWAAAAASSREMAAGVAVPDPAGDSVQLQQPDRGQAQAPQGPGPGHRRPASLRKGLCR